jgi:hypothetical protein
MDKQGMIQHENKFKIIKAIVHWKRIFIIVELSKEKRCIYEIGQLIKGNFTKNQLIPWRL